MVTYLRFGFGLLAAVLLLSSCNNHAPAALENINLNITLLSGGETSRSLASDPQADWALVEVRNGDDTIVGDGVFMKSGGTFSGSITVSEGGSLRFTAFVGPGTADDAEPENALFAGEVSQNIPPVVPVSILVGRQKTLSFDANGGTGTMADLSRDIGSSAALPTLAFKRSGYVFLHWAEQSDGSGTTAAGGADYTMKPADTTLYAQWKAITFGAKQTNPFGLTKVNDYSGLDVNSAPALKDMDGDGDLDLFSGERTGITRYAPGGMTFGTIIDNAFGIGTVSNFTRITLADLNGDGKTDVIIGNESGYFFFYENTGTVGSPAFTLRSGIDNPLNGRTPADGAAPAFGDLDGDGDLDLVAGQWQGYFYYFENTGTASAPVFPAPSGDNKSLFGLPQLIGYSHPAFGDLDEDGDLDILSGSSTGSLFYIENTGTASSPAFAAAQENPFGLASLGVSQSTPYLVDYDGDGDLDIFSGGINGDLFYFENTTKSGGEN